MRAEMRSTMQTVARVRVFNVAHPVADPGLVPVIADFDRRAARADALISQQAESDVRSRAANRARALVRKRLQDGLLALFGSLFALEADEHPALRGIKVPERRFADPAFLVAADRIVAAARDHQELLAGHGLTKALLDEAAASLERFREISAEARAAFQARVEASRALDTTRLEIVGAIQRRDKLNRYRFADHPELLAGWDTARNIVVRPSRHRQEVPVPAETPEGDVADAA